MKRRRLVISLFLIAAFSLIGIGYAVLSNDLLVSSDITVNPNDGNLKVEFVNLPTTDSNSAIVVTSIDSQEVAVKFNNTNEINAQGQSQEITLTVKNNSVGAVGTELDATLSSFEIVSGSLSKVEEESTATKVVYSGTHFTISAEWVNADDLVLEAERTGVDAGTNQIKITITLNVTVTEKINQHAFSIKFNATTK